MHSSQVLRLVLRLLLERRSDQLRLVLQHHCLLAVELRQVLRSSLVPSFLKIQQLNQ